MNIRLALLSSIAAGALLAAAATHATAANFKVAFLASSSQNGYNQSIYQGIQDEAKKLGDVDVEIYDGAFDSAKQYSQVEDLTAGGKFNALIITPNDTVGIATAVEEATKAGLKVATTLFPIGPKLDTLEPQVPGLTTTVAADPSIGAAAQAQAVVDYCAKKDPCNVIVMIGQLIYPFDNLRNNTYKKVLADHPNIKIVATGEGNYDPQKSLTVMQNLLQANPKIDVVLSNADQHLVGVEIALKDAGIDPSKVYLMGGGLNQITVDAIRAGQASATLADHPYLTGVEAMKALHTTLTGGTAPTAINVLKLGTTPLIVDKAWLDAHPDFKAEWQG